MKKCNLCGEQKPVEEFPFSCNKKLGIRRAVCVPCFRDQERRKKQDRAAEKGRTCRVCAGHFALSAFDGVSRACRPCAAAEGLRKCRTCGAQKPTADFDPMPGKTHKLRRSCRGCCGGHYVADRTCTRCKEVKPTDAFSPRENRPGPRSWCKQCHAEVAADWAAAHPEEKAAKERAYRAAHLEDHRAYMRKYANARYSADPAFRLAKRLRSLVYAAVTRAGGKKAGSVVHALGCTSDELRAHLEKQWTVGMSWETHGDKGWHIEHIKPLAWFDLTDRAQFLEACHYTNLQPMWWDKNLEKRSADGVLGKKPKPATLEPPCPGPANWQVVSKADRRCRVLADMHYSRQTVGAAMFTRPGYNQVLYRPRAVFVWWRPKWECGIPGTSRYDSLECIECTLFRNEQSGVLSSELILAAEQMLLQWDRARDVPIKDGLVTSVGVPHTAARRGKNSRPGECYLRAGWGYFKHPTSKRTDLVWLRKALPF